MPAAASRVYGGALEYWSFGYVTDQASIVGRRISVLMY